MFSVSLALGLVEHGDIYGFRSFVFPCKQLLRFFFSLETGEVRKQDRKQVESVRVWAMLSGNVLLLCNSRL